MYMCENFGSTRVQVMTSLCSLVGTQTLLWQARKDRVCVILPCYLSTIFHCSVTFTSSLLSRQVSSSP